MREKGDNECGTCRAHLTAKTNESMSDLKKCPLCGGKAVFIFPMVDDRDIYMGVTCRKCGHRILGAEPMRVLVAEKTDGKKSMASVMVDELADEWNTQ